MRIVESLLFGSAAGLLAIGGAQAADLPVKAKAVEYVRICSLYGAGFYYIPGTDTCIKIGGYLRAELNIHGGNGNQPFWSGDGAVNDRYENQYNDRAVMALTVDTRTATEYGVVRTFGQVDTYLATYGVANNINVQGSLNVAASSGGTLPNTVGAGVTVPEFLFIQFAGFTFGKSASAFNTPWHGFLGNNTAYLVGGYDTVSGLNNIQYTANFGNGVSGTIGVDDSSATGYNRTQIFNATLLGAGTFLGGTNTTSAAAGVAPTAGASGCSLGGYGAASGYCSGVGTAYSGTIFPDVVGNIRVDQAWGMFQVSGAVHDVSPGYWTQANTLGGATFLGGVNQLNSQNLGHPDSRAGGAVMTALQLKNIPTGAGDDIKVEGSWSLGASKYVLGTASTSGGSYYMLADGPAGSAGKLAIGSITDAVYGGFGTPLQAGVQLTRGWGFRGAFNHNWSPEWSSTLFGGIARLSYSDTAKGLWCASFGSSTPTGGALPGGLVVTGAPAGAKSADYNCDPGFTMSQVGVTTRWSPVKNLTFSSEVLYSYLKSNMAGSATLTSVSTAIPTAGNSTYFFGSMGTVSANFRVQRNF